MSLFLLGTAIVIARPESEKKTQGKTHELEDIRVAELVAWVLS
jgi:hypothetical protein